MNLHLRHRPAPEGVGELADVSEEQKQPNTRRRKVIRVASAVALAGGIAGGALTLGSGKSKPSKSSENAPATTVKPNNSLPSTAPSTPETTSPNTVQTQSAVAANLCTAVSANIINAAMSSESASAQCTTTSDSGESILPFTALDISHAVWGGPEGQAPVVAVTIRNLMNYGQDLYKQEQQVESSSQEVPVSVDNFPATFIPKENDELNGATVYYETVFVSAGQYIVNVVLEQPSGGAIPSESGMLSLASNIITQGINS